LQPHRITDFEAVEWLQSSGSGEGGQLQMEASGEAEPLIIKCSSLAQADDIADLITGYCHLFGNTRMTWTRKGQGQLQISAL
jgi:hypothetical protein